MSWRWQEKRVSAGWRVHQLEGCAGTRQWRREMGRRSGIVRRALSGLVIVGLGILGLWTAPRWLVPRIAAWSPRCLYSVATGEKLVALTIDDGPDLVETPEILRVLQEHDARATFFLISGKVPGAESVVTAVVDAGHEVGNHLTREEPSIRLSPAAFGTAVRQADTALSRFARPRWLRPGAGWYTGTMLDTIEQAKYRCALGSVYPFDGRVTWPPLAAAYIVANARPGAVLVLHEGRGRGRRAVSILRRVLPELRARGYRVVTLSALAASARPSRHRPVPPATAHNTPTRSATEGASPCPRACRSSSEPRSHSPGRQPSRTPP